jgi:hypothetical protein
MGSLLALVVAGSSAVLVASSPVRPGVRAGPDAVGLDDSDGEQAADLAAGQRDQAGGGRPIDVFGCGDHSQQGVRDHRQQGPALPRGPPAHLMFIEPSQALASLEGLLDRPAASGDADQLPAAAHRSGSSVHDFGR